MEQAYWVARAMVVVARLTSQAVIWMSMAYRVENGQRFSRRRRPGWLVVVPLASESVVGSSGALGILRVWGTAMAIQTELVAASLESSRPMQRTVRLERRVGTEAPR